MKDTKNYSISVKKFRKLIPEICRNMYFISSFSLNKEYITPIGESFEYTTAITRDITFKEDENKIKLSVIFEEIHLSELLKTIQESTEKDIKGLSYEVYQLDRKGNTLMGFKYHNIKIDNIVPTGYSQDVSNISYLEISLSYETKSIIFN
jgi:hypothetical protein